MSEMERNATAAEDIDAQEDAYQKAEWAPGMGVAPAVAKPAGPHDVERLMARMATRRDVLLGILDFCSQPREVAEVDAFVGSSQAHNASVYDGASLCAMLQAAGALECVAPEGASDDGVPQVEVVDGVEYARPAKRAQALWRTTQVGAGYLAGVDRRADLARLLDEDAAYMDIYLRVLDLCAQDGGAATPALSAAIDKDPLVQSPRFFAQHFTERLEKAGAVRWDGTWKLTDLGRSYLDGAAR